MSDNNILYLGKKSTTSTQVDFVTGDLPQISGFTGHIQDAVLQASVDSITTGKAPSASGVYDFVTGVSGWLSENSNDTLYDLTGEDGDLTNSSKITLTAENNGGETDTSVTLLGGQDISISNNGSTITIAHSGTTSASSSYNSVDSVINGVGIDGRGHVTGFTTTGLDGRYYTETEIDSILDPVYNYSGNWDTAYDRSVTGVDFNTSNGDLILQRQNDSNITVSTLDEYYLFTGTPSLQYVTNIGNTTNTGIEVKSIKIGIDGASEISTTAGDLTLDSADGTVIVDDNIFIKGNATITGNLLVSGTTTTVNSSVTTISDPILTLGSGTIAADDGKDRGIEFIYYDEGINTGFFGYDNEDKRFAFFTGATNTNENFSGVAAPLDLSATVDDSTIEYIDGSSFLQVKNLGITNAKLQNSSLTVTAGSGLANGGTVSLGGSTTLDIGEGDGIKVNDNSIEVSGYHGITVNSSGVSVTPSSGILVNADGVSVTGHNGITVDENGVSTVSDQNHLNKIEIGKDNVTTEIINSYGGLVVGRGYSSDGSPVSLTQAGNGDGGGGEPLIDLPANSTLTAEGVITARDDSQNPSTSASWKFVSTIISDASSPDTKMSHITKIYSDPEASTWTVSITANNDPNGLEIQGAAQGHDHGVAWSCTVNYNILGA